LGGRKIAFGALVAGRGGGTASSKRSVTVTVAGQRLALRTDADEAYVRELASVVDHKIQQLKGGSRGVATDSAALMAALQLADDLCREREELLDLKRKVRDKSRSILELIRREAKLS
jgi:cell division protein ZapA